MLAVVLATGMFLQAGPVAQDAKPAATQPPANPSKDANLDPAALLKVKRIYVENFGDDTTSKELQSMIVSTLVTTKRFKVTENRERADAILKGVALEKSSQELHSYGGSTAAGHAAISDSSSHTETLNEAKVSIRLVSTDGDVIWTTVQESKGGKYKGASADAADKCVKELLRDIERLERANTPPPPTAASQHN